MRQSARVTACTSRFSIACSKAAQRGSRKTNRSRQTLVSRTMRRVLPASISAPAGGEKAGARVDMPPGDVLLVSVLIVKTACFRRICLAGAGVQVITCIEDVVALIADAPELMNVDRHQTAIMQQPQMMQNQLRRGVLGGEIALDLFNIAVRRAE